MYGSDASTMNDQHQQRTSPKGRRRSFVPIPRRPGERAVGAFFRVVTRVAGLQPALIPAHMRRQLAIIGIDETMLGRVLDGVRSLGDWPYAWEAEGDRHMADCDYYHAAASYYVAQRVLLTESPLKRRLYELAKHAYGLIDHAVPLEHVAFQGLTQTIAGILQVPTSRRAPVPLVVMVPGITAAKEEMHPFAEPLLRRGYAVCRIDNPGYGDTTGVIGPGSERNPAVVIRGLAGDARIDASDMHLLGTSMGGFWALHSAPHAQVRSVIAISAPFDPAAYIDSLPSMNLTALQHMTGSPDYEHVIEYCNSLTLRAVAPRIRVPVKLVHGGRDRTIPVHEFHEARKALGGPVSTTLYPNDHHVCLEHLHEMMGDVLHWLHDPVAAARSEAGASREDRIAAFFDNAAETAGASIAHPEPGVA